MEYYAIYFENSDDADAFVFESKEDALKVLKNHKNARLKPFKSKSDALKFAKNGQNSSSTSFLDAVLKSPPPNQLPLLRSLEKSNFPSLKPQDMVKFRKEIEQKNVQRVYEMIYLNPRYLVSSGDTPAILKEGPRYNALHIAAMNNLPMMAKLILQTVAQTKFIELLHGVKNDPNAERMSEFLLESYLNTPDKSRNETPLHFAAKIGAVDVIKVLISYPLCKMKKNSEGLHPKDIICDRAPLASAELKESIANLLNERYFVPVLRSNDSSIQPVIGEPFTPANMPQLHQDPLTPKLEIKAYAGPMSSEQAQLFRRRWKTPPRMIPCSTNGSGNLNVSFSPHSSCISSPISHSRMSKSMNEVISSTPKTKKKLFQGDEADDDFHQIFIDNMGADKNGNLKIATDNVLGEHEEDEFNEIYDDLMEDKIRMQQEEKDKTQQERSGAMFQAYRNPEPIMATPKVIKNDSNSNHLHHNFNENRRMNSNDSLFCNPRSSSSSAMMTFLDESGSIYNSDNIFESPSFKEKNIRLMDPDKGLEQIGRALAQEQNIGWMEYWDFLERLVNIRNDEGLMHFETYLKQKEKSLELNESNESEKSQHNNSFGLSDICSGFYTMDINEVINEKPVKPIRNGLTSPLSPISRQSLITDFQRGDSKSDFKLVNPFTCIEQSCRSFAKRLVHQLESESVQDQHSYEKTLLMEIIKLNTSIDNYKRDSRFSDVNFQKVHSRYSFLVVWYLKKNNVEVKYLRNFVELMSKVYALASQFGATGDLSKEVNKCHAVCLSKMISIYIEMNDKIFNPENVDTETGCVDAWNGPDIIECSCLFEISFANSKKLQSHRREIRKKLYAEKPSNNLMKLDLWAARTSSVGSDDEIEDNDETYLSCSESSDSSDEFFTPPTSPTRFFSDSDDDMNAYEESFENLDEEKGFKLFIGGEEPTKTDRDVYNALGDNFAVDSTKYKLVSEWYKAMTALNAKTRELESNNHFRLFTPKLKKFC